MSRPKRTLSSLVACPGSVVGYHGKKLCPAKQHMAAFHCWAFSECQATSNSSAKTLCLVMGSSQPYRGGLLLASQNLEKPLAQPWPDPGQLSQPEVKWSQRTKSHRCMKTLHFRVSALRFMICKCSLVQVCVSSCPDFEPAQPSYDCCQPQAQTLECQLPRMLQSVISVCSLSNLFLIHHGLRNLHFGSIL